MSKQFDADHAVELYVTAYEADYRKGHTHTRAKRAGKAAVEAVYPDVNWQDRSFTDRLPSMLTAIRNRIDAGRDDTPPMLGVPRPSGDDSGGGNGRAVPRPGDVMRQWFAENDTLVFMPKFMALATGYSDQAHANYLYASQKSSLLSDGYVIEVERKGGVVTAVCQSRPAPPVDETVVAAAEILKGLTAEQWDALIQLRRNS